MSPAPNNKLRFSDVVYALETTPKTLRNWLAREQVTLSETNQGWREFTFNDLAVLALVKCLSQHGLPIEESDAIAVEVLRTRFSKTPWILRAPPEAFLAGLWQHRLMVVFEGGEWKYAPLIADQNAPEHAAFLTINLNLLIGRAFRRAIESADEGKTQLDEE